MQNNGRQRRGRRDKPRGGSEEQPLTNESSFGANSDRRRRRPDSRTHHSAYDPNYVPGKNPQYTDRDEDRGQPRQDVTREQNPSDRRGQRPQGGRGNHGGQRMQRDPNQSSGRRYQQRPPRRDANPAPLGEDGQPVDPAQPRDPGGRPRYQGGQRRSGGYGGNQRSDRGQRPQHGSRPHGGPRRQHSSPNDPNQQERPQGGPRRQYSGPNDPNQQERRYSGPRRQYSGSRNPNERRHSGPRRQYSNSSDPNQQERRQDSGSYRRNNYGRRNSQPRDGEAQPLTSDSPTMRGGGGRRNSRGQQDRRGPSGKGAGRGRMSFGVAKRRNSKEQGRSTVYTSDMFMYKENLDPKKPSERKMRSRRHKPNSDTHSEES